MALYSLNGAYPTTLPHRIVLSDGRTRTDSSTFTNEELADAGYVSVPDKPTPGLYQEVEWDGSSWSVVDFSDNDMRRLAQQARNNVPAARWEKEVSNIIWQDSDNRSYIIDNSVESQRKIASVQTAINTGIREDNQVWKIYAIGNDSDTIPSGIIYRTTKNSELQQWSDLVLRKVQICFNTEKEVIEMMDSDISAGNYLKAIETSYDSAFNVNITAAGIVMA